jgi:serine-type D-Ala-D-Ala carboxypeptidase
VSRLTQTEAVLAHAIAEQVFPGAIVEVGTRSGPLHTVACGRLTYEPSAAMVTADTIYDLASLTKVLATATLAADAITRDRLSLTDRLADLVPAWTGADRRDVTVQQLLEHASGLPAHRPYFVSLETGAAIVSAICAEPLEYPPGTQSVYSDTGFILLGQILEHVLGDPLATLFDAWRAEQVPDAHPLGYQPPDTWIARIAPTEVDAWRGRLLHGEVHDENAAVMGGVAAHAGLFGTASAVGAIARWWMRMADQSTLHQRFLTRGAVPGSSRALGWDTMLPTSSCGTRMTASAAGHTGFTGTSLWLDRDLDRYVVLLTNRVHPSRRGEAMQRVRPALHDALAADLARS